jgi:hypothetical protein
LEAVTAVVLVVGLHNTMTTVSTENTSMVGLTLPTTIPAQEPTLYSVRGQTIAGEVVVRPCHVTQGAVAVVVVIPVVGGVGGDAIGHVHAKEITMNRDFKVKDVQKFVRGYSVDSIHAVQQILQWFGANKKLERIIWSAIKSRQLHKKKLAEIGVNIELEKVTKRKEGKPYHPPVETIREPDDISLVIGMCPRCGRVLKGMPMRPCTKGKGSRFGKLTFYKECSSCPYYSEIFKRRNKFKEVEGG